MFIPTHFSIIIQAPLVSQESWLPEQWAALAVQKLCRSGWGEDQTCPTWSPVVGRSHCWWGRFHGEYDTFLNFEINITRLYVNIVFPELRIWLVDLLHGQGIKPWTKRRAMPLSMGSRGSLAKYRHQTNHVQRRDQRLLNKRLLRPQFSEWSDYLIIASLFYIGNPFERNNHAWLEADQQANNTAHKYLTEAATLTNTLSLAGCDKVLLDCNPPMSQC